MESTILKSILWERPQEEVWDLREASFVSKRSPESDTVVNCLHTRESICKKTFFLNDTLRSISFSLDGQMWFNLDILSEIFHELNKNVLTVPPPTSPEEKF